MMYAVTFRFFFYFSV
ncbi:pheST operon leader peptide PheM [Yersinia kristensenii]|nr:pheST operon leader peptide PheM [Yersinia kristensenii]MBW5826518.1 pheST operon leader peptide PheM [Yersinia kristensenii]MBW5831120.1 pheST operon leader peptide PheM [Yersinia kristensenii]NIK94274.1 pheST operon leader peptide PheM [Yersinia kristensenii]NIL05814.1 pheST operon leader peptide PheM [Yersinia kristensenii]